MRRIILFTWVLLLSVSGYAQVSADIGVWGGGSNYTGDLENRTITEFTFPTVGAFFRYNFHYRTSLRAQFLTGKVAGNGLILGKEFRGIGDNGEEYVGFNKLVQDLTLQVEINYLRYMLGNNKASFTSYVMAGVGVMYYPYQYDPGFFKGVDPANFDPQSPYSYDPNYYTGINPEYNKGDSHGNQSVIAPSIPFGMGFKFNIGSRMGIGVEYQMRKLFDDRLDNLDDPLAYKRGEESVTYRNMFHNNDWVGFLGVHLTYKIYLGSKPCPAYDVKN